MTLLMFKAIAETGRLMLAYLLTCGDEWDGAAIRALEADYETESKESLNVLRQIPEEALGTPVEANPDDLQAERKY